MSAAVKFADAGLLLGSPTFSWRYPQDIHLECIGRRRRLHGLAARLAPLPGGLQLYGVEVAEQAGSRCAIDILHHLTFLWQHEDFVPGA
jgi:hypothetical protein